MGAIHKQEGTAELKRVGVIHSPYMHQEDAPRQGRLSDKESTIEVLPAFAEGLQDVESYPHLIVLYWLDRADRGTLKATPPGTHVEHGVFATRSPNRPNPIAFSVVDFVRRDGNRLVVRGLDALDGTPLLDLKPYSAGIDCVRE
ncbi:MAG: tRNA (N6-threonylcarbamoyladenosine(37)-N6)-methyltransferase TrmO [Methanoregula sp.]|nr:tRNA (N6-threonylcarbamoyladenosine(37)-N6)-methyltransferase TrmO [Methanoregula sp.]